MKLFVARHSEAGPHVEDPEEERERELTDGGVEMAVAVARELKARGEPLPRVILASDYARTRQTADIFGKLLGVPVSFTSVLSPFLPIADFVRQMLDDENSKRVMLVGHHDNLVPGFSELGGEMGEFDYDGDDVERGVFPMLAKAEVRRLSIDRESGEWECKDRICPSDVGFRDSFE